MYNLKHLGNIARDGLTDMLPAVRQAFNDDPADDRLNEVYGPWPRATIFALAILGITAGEVFARNGPEFDLKHYVNWPAVFVAVLFAALIRRYLFRSKRAQVSDFPWLAASLAPAAVLLIPVSVVSKIASGIDPADAATVSVTARLGGSFVLGTDALGVVAALTIAVATLCFSRKWLTALWHLAIRLFVFKLMVWITAVVMLEVGIVGPIISTFLRSVFGLEIPDWLPDLFDQLSYAALLSVAYLAVIGATWIVCRNSFCELLETGDVNILDSVVGMARKARKKKNRNRTAPPSTQGKDP